MLLQSRVLSCIALVTTQIYLFLNRFALRHHSYLQKICQLFTPLDMELRNKLKRRVFEMTAPLHSDIAQHSHLLQEPKCSSPSVSEMTREREPSMCLPVSVKYSYYNLS